MNIMSSFSNFKLVIAISVIAITTTLAQKEDITGTRQNVYVRAERTKQMEQILNFQVPAEGLELVILLHTQY